jgi:hypothetical protein
VESFSSYIYVPIPWVEHTKTTVRGAPILGNPSCSKSYFSHPSLAVAVAVVAALPSPSILCSATSKSAAVPAVLQLVATSCRCSVAMQFATHCRALRHDGTELFAGQFQQCLHDVLCVLSPPELLCKDGRRRRQPRHSELGLLRHCQRQPRPAAHVVRAT